LIYRLTVLVDTPIELAACAMVKPSFAIRLDKSIDKPLVLSIVVSSKGGKFY